VDVVVRIITFFRRVRCRLSLSVVRGFFLGFDFLLLFVLCFLFLLLAPPLGVVMKVVVVWLYP
jgi:hypothetical protein